SAPAENIAFIAPEKWAQPPPVPNPRAFSGSYILHVGAPLTEGSLRAGAAIKQNHNSSGHSGGGGVRGRPFCRRRVTMCNLFSTALLEVQAKAWF
ncbi:Nuclear pore complex protein Nup154, partial [Dissostichus eleginoides]